MHHFRERGGLLFVLAGVCWGQDTFSHPSARVTQSLSGVGFRRNLTLTVRTDRLEECLVAAVQQLPSAVFLDDLRLEPSDVGQVLKSISVFQEQEPEVFAENASSQTVVLFTKLSGGTATAWLSLHTRYSCAVSGGVDVLPVLLTPPVVYFNCRSAAEEIYRACTTLAPDSRQCMKTLAESWILLEHRAVPAILSGITRGNADHISAVVFLTMLCTIGACVCVLSGVQILKPPLLVAKKTE